jgi:hypothetical protein
MMCSILSGKPKTVSIRKRKKRFSNPRGEPFIDSTMYNPHLVNMKFIPGAQLLRGVEGVCGHVRNTALE